MTAELEAGTVGAGLEKKYTQSEAAHAPFASAQVGYVHNREWALGLVLFEKKIDSFFWRSVLIEFLGMVAFLFSVITTICYNTDRQLEGVDSDKQLLISLVFGLSIFLLVYFTAGLSGGNLNPAVSWSLMWGRKISVVRCISYILAQCMGAVVGAGLAKAVAGAERFNSSYGGTNTLMPGVDDGQAMLGEIICTCMLCLAVLIGLSGELWNLMEKTKMDMLLPVAVGTAVVLGHMILIPVDGCSINPARSFGPAVIYGRWTSMWVFWIGPLIGATIAILLWEGVLRPPMEINIEELRLRREAEKAAKTRSGSFRALSGQFVAPHF